MEVYDVHMIYMMVSAPPCCSASPGSLAAFGAVGGGGGLPSEGPNGGLREGFFSGF